MCESTQSAINRTICRWLAGRLTTMSLTAVSDQSGVHPLPPERGVHELIVIPGKCSQVLIAADEQRGGLDALHLERRGRMEVAGGCSPRRAQVHPFSERVGIAPRRRRKVFFRPALIRHGHAKAGEGGRGIGAPQFRDARARVPSAVPPEFNSYDETAWRALESVVRGDRPSEFARTIPEIGVHDAEHAGRTVLAQRGRARGDYASTRCASSARSPPRSRCRQSLL